MAGRHAYTKLGQDQGKRLVKPSLVALAGVAVFGLIFLGHAKHKQSAVELKPSFPPGVPYWEVAKQVAFIGSEPLDHHPNKETIAAFCPWTGSERDYIPTLILRGDSQREPHAERTTFLADPDTGAGTSFGLKYNSEHIWIDQQLYGFKGRPIQVCTAHAVPSSVIPTTPAGWSDHKLMFGMATTPQNVSDNVSVWRSWLSHLDGTLDLTRIGSTGDLAKLVVLTPPTETLIDRSAFREAQRKVVANGMNVQIRALNEDRPELRFFALAQAMWDAGIAREQKEGIRVDWFAFVDDDTFVADLNSVVNILAEYDPSRPHLIGSPLTDEGEFKGVAQSGAGIFLSRKMLEVITQDGMLNKCLDQFATLTRGDAILSRCAHLALRMDKPFEQLGWLTNDHSLHSINWAGENVGWFQSGALVNSFNKWTPEAAPAFPSWHPHRVEDGVEDLREDPILLGAAAKAVGSGNWLRRYVFEQGRAVVHLGYSVVIYSKTSTADELTQVEQTWTESSDAQINSDRPTKEELTEGKQKRSYYLTSVRPLAHDVWALEHTNKDHERVDIVWDGRTSSIVNHRKPAF